MAKTQFGEAKSGVDCVTDMDRDKGDTLPFEGTTTPKRDDNRASDGQPKAVPRGTREEGGRESREKETEELKEKLQTKSEALRY
jgi:hypothetical protein